ncbi:DUF1289 domain-containing protein [Methylobacterium platani]|uniref:Fe-S oxidoreductase n=2 Tax=Methylobacterium platani TaxID=427683 RepID=A0A179S9J2_9HYPH|nr:DUF1289 domain-containing protein [Methylobacterium platani]KMO20250.1 Fe-S oxidoreductase [Methylobacterium platani JCM 14648]OAS24065.1 Fe-S oxidoreductase [Methylobacterium platani]
MPASSPTPSSPCIRLCVLDPVSGLCEGCGRTGSEIAAWGGLPEAERLRIMAGLPARLAALEAGALPEPGPAPAVA